MERPKLSIEDILKLPYKRIKELAQEHKDALSGRDYDSVSQIAHLHVLKLKLLDKYKDFFNDVLVESLREEAGKRTIDGSIVRLLRDNPEDIPTFEQYKRDKMTATSMRGEGNIFEVYSVLRKGLVAKTFATIFSDPRKFRRADSAYNFIEHLKESVEADYNDEENPNHTFARGIMKRLRPVKPKYGKDNTLAVTFVDANDLHDEVAIKGLDINQRIEYLKEISDVYLAMAVFGDKYKSSMSKGIIQRIFGSNDIEKIDHGTEFLDRFCKGMGINPLEDFNSVMKRYVFDELAKEKARFAKGDCLPSNEMVSHDPEVGKSNGSDRVYSPIDFEFACFDAVQASLVQLWSKFGILDHRGESLRTKNGKEAEKELLDHSYKTFIRLLNLTGQTKEAETYSRERFEKVYDLIKIENDLMWARRYHAQSKNPQIDNPEDSALNARYYFSLAAREMVRQGIIKGVDDPVLKPLSARFGEPLREKSDNKDEFTLEYVANKFDPHARLVSFLKSDTILDPQKEIDGLVTKLKQHKRGRVYKSIGMAAGALALVAGVIATAYWGIGYQNKTRELEGDIEINRWMPMFRHVNNSAIYGSEGIWKYGMYTKYETIFQDKETAMAACLNLQAVYEAAEANGIKINYDAIENYDGMKNSPLPYDKIEEYIREHYQNINIALIEAEDYADNFMRTPQTQDYIEDQIKGKSQEARRKIEEEKARKQRLTQERTEMRGPMMDGMNPK